MAKSVLIGKTGRVTGRVASGTTGEVAIEVRGTVEHFLAFPYIENQAAIEKGSQVLVEDCQGRSVYVVPAP